MSNMDIPEKEQKIVDLRKDNDYNQFVGRLKRITNKQTVPMITGKEKEEGEESPE